MTYTYGTDGRVMYCPECGRVASVASWCERPVCVHAWDGNAGIPEIWDGNNVDGLGHRIEDAENPIWREPGPCWSEMKETPRRRWRFWR